MSQIAGLLNSYGYLALFVGAFLEGETILVLAGFAVQRGYMDFWWVSATAFAGSFLGDQLYFHLGTHWGARWIARRRSWQGPAARARRLLDRYGALFVLVFRFLYGLRTVSPFVIGIGGYPRGRFLALNMIAAAIWAVSVAGLGYGFGEAFVSVIERVKTYELHAFGAIAATGAVLLIGYWIRQRIRNGGSAG